jgi:hypothetical protein
VGKIWYEEGGGFFQINFFDNFLIWIQVLDKGPRVSWYAEIYDWSSSSISLLICFNKNIKIQSVARTLGWDLPNSPNMVFFSLW